MTTIIIGDLPHDEDLDREAMLTIRGGKSFDKPYQHIDHWDLRPYPARPILYHPVDPSKPSVPYEPAIPTVRQSLPARHTVPNNGLFR
jgi:hypothetical protein